MIFVELVADGGSSSKKSVTIRCSKIEKDPYVTGNVLLHLENALGVIMPVVGSIRAGKWSVPSHDINMWVEGDSVNDLRNEALKKASLGVKPTTTENTLKPFSDGVDDKGSSDILEKDTGSSDDDRDDANKKNEGAIGSN